MSNNAVALTLLLVVMGTIYSQAAPGGPSGPDGYILSSAPSAGRETERTIRTLDDPTNAATLDRYSYDPIELGVSTPIEHHVTINNIVNSNPPVEQVAPAERIKQGHGF